MTMFLGGIVRRSAGGRRLLSCPHSRDLSSMNVLSVNKGSLMTLSRRRVPSPTCGLATLGRGAAAAFDNAKPLESVRTDDVSLESAYIPLAIPSGRPLTEFPYFLSATTLKTAKLLTAFNLSPLGNKNLVLVSPHPGSRRLLYHVVNDVALGLKAGVLSLDYQWFVKEFKALQRSGLKYPQTYDGPMNKLPLIPDSRAFSPSYYEQFDVEEDVDEDDDTPSEDEVDSGSSASSRRKMLENALLKSVKGNNQRNEAGDLPKMVFNVNIVQEAPSAFNTTDGKISRVDIQPASTESKGPQESSKISGLTKGTHYSTIIPANALQVLMTRIKEFILSRPDKPAIIQLQDLSDMMEGSNVTGRRIVLGLNAMVASLRKDHGVSCVLAMHSYPPLLDPENLDLTLNFYDDLFEGNIAVKDNYDSESDSSMWADGTFFKTTLDAAKSLPLEKIEIAPPAPTLVIKQDSFDGVRMQDDFNDYLHQLDKETLLSVRELNLKSLEMVCKDKGVSLSPLTTMALISRPTEADTQDVLKPIPEATFLLDDSVWTLEELDRLVSLAAAKAMEENSIKRNIEVKTEHLDQALELIRSTDHSRLVIGSTSVSPRSSLLDDSSMPLSPEIPNKASSGKTFEKKAPESKQPDPCSVTAFLKKNNVQLNAHEKKLIGTVIDPSKIRTSFSDLVLPPSTKLILQTLVTLPFMRPAYFESGILSKHYINGVLLFGPPGTGKTLLAKAVAKSSGARFMNVSLSNIFDKFVGEGEKNVKAIFTLARKLSPCVVFLDEIDALFGARRNEGTQSSKREIVNEFMSEWDGLASNNQGVMILGATNRPFDLDDAILRRMPRRVLIDLPTEQQRKQIFSIHLGGESLHSELSLEELSKRTEHYSGSDIKNVCVAAALGRVKESILRETLEMSEDKDDAAISKKLSALEDWNTVLGSEPVSSSQEKELSLPPLTSNHFDLAFKEVPPSLTDEMQTLVELRKWNAVYGENGGSKKKGPSWGFSNAEEVSSKKVEKEKE